jgi:hypothetical protein
MPLASKNFCIVLFVGIYLLSNHGCIPNSSSDLCQQFNELYGLEESQALSLFNDMSSESQVDFFLCAVMHEPPHLEYASHLANHCVTVSPILLRKLTETDDDFVTTNIIYAFKEISDKCDFDSQTRSHIIDQIRKSTRSINNLKLRNISETDLDFIRKNWSR